MATSLVRPAEETNFIGPAQQKFETFLELAKFSLTTNCPNWNNFDQPESYVIPPIFYYKNPELYDEIIEEAEAQGAVHDSKHPLFKKVLFRRSEKAEHDVYKSIYDLSQEKLHAPFIAVHNLNIQNTKHLLPLLFPTNQWKELRGAVESAFHDQLLRLLPSLDDKQRQKMEQSFSEQFSTALVKYNMDFDLIKDHIELIGEIKDPLRKIFNSFFRENDFVIIGPKIGLMVIEVKHSYFSAKKDFANRYLPGDFADGINQLQDFDKLLVLFKDITGTDAPKNSVRKILFLPNLKKERFDTWYNNLDIAAKQNCDDRLKKVDQIWFNEDMNNDFQKSPLYGKLRDLINSSSQTWSKHMFEAYCPLMIGLASVAFLKTNREFELRSIKLSETKALTDEGELVETHDPSRHLKQSISATTAETHFTVQVNKIILLTPEQKAGFEGPPRQFIIGPAGGGKTIIVQAKALELLKAEKSVGVVTTAFYAKHYAEVFGQHGFTSKQHASDPDNGNYDIMTDWSGWNQAHLIPETLENPDELFHFLQELMRNALDDVNGVVNFCSVPQVKMLLDNDALIVDDMLDHSASRAIDINPSAFLLFALLLMEFGRIFCPDKIIWAVFDTRMTNQTPGSLQMRLLQGFLQLDTNNPDADFAYTITKLNRVMRCPENVFQAAYDTSALIGRGTRALLGHKLQGIVNRIRICSKWNKEPLWNETKNNSNSQWLLIWNEIKKQLNRLDAEGFNFNEVVIIAGYSMRIPEGTFEGFLLQKCEECGIPAATITQKQQELQIWQTSSTTSSTKGILMIYNSFQISSMEWRIVIYVCPDDGPVLHYENHLLQHYRARSRATAKLIEISLFDGTKRRNSLGNLQQNNGNDNALEVFLHYDERKRNQLTNMAGDCHLLAHFSLTLDLTFEANRRAKLLDVHLRRRSYSVHEICTKKCSLEAIKENFDNKLCRFLCRFNNS